MTVRPLLFLIVERRMKWTVEQRSERVTVRRMALTDEGRSQQFRLVLTDAKSNEGAQRGKQMRGTEEERR